MTVVEGSRLSRVKLQKHAQSDTARGYNVEGDAVCASGRDWNSGLAVFSIFYKKQDTYMAEIVFFHCRDVPETPTGEALVELVAGLLASGRNVKVWGDLAGLAAAKAPQLAALAECDELCVVSPYYPRAVCGLMKYADAELPLSANIIVTQGKAPSAILAELFDSPPQADATHLAQAREHLETIPTPADEQWRPWFPVIDGDRCTACGQCEAFCLFGVYEIAGPAVRVARPANCKNNCPACARVCPQQAIIFPKHNAAPINANDSAAPQADVMPGFGDLRDPDVMEKLRTRAAAARAAAERKRAAREEE